MQKEITYHPPMMLIRYLTFCSPVNTAWIWLLLSLFLVQPAYTEIIHSPNTVKPHLARDISIHVPASFDRFSHNSGISFRDLNNTNKYLRTTTKNLFPDTDYHITLGGFSPQTEYEIEITVLNGGSSSHKETITFTTDSAPADETRYLLLVIDEDLNDPMLERAYENYISDVITQEKNLQAEKYYLQKSFMAQKDLYSYIHDNYFDKNLYYLFFIGSNASFPVEINLLDEEGGVAHSYHYEGLSFYTHVWNNPYQYDAEGDRYIINYGLNNSAMPDLYTPFVNNGSMAEISFGAIIPTSNVIADREQQVLNYLNKISRYRRGQITFDQRILYSDTIWGNTNLENTIDQITRWSDNVAIDTTHDPSSTYHGPDPQWVASYLENLKNGSFEVGWINVHGSSRHHYFGVSHSDISHLPQLNIAYINLKSCSTGNYKYNSYLAGEYLNTGNVLAVEANMNVTFYVGNSSVNDFSTGSAMYELAKGKSIGDAVRQHGAVFTGHVLFGDPLLIIGDPPVHTPSKFPWALFMPAILSTHQD